MTDAGKECPRCGRRILAFMEGSDGVSCHPCGHRLSEGEYLALKEAFLGGDDSFGFGGDWWKG